MTYFRELEQYTSYYADPCDLIPIVKLRFEMMCLVNFHHGDGWEYVDWAASDWKHSDWEEHCYENGDFTNHFESLEELRQKAISEFFKARE